MLRNGGSPTEQFEYSLPTKPQVSQMPPLPTARIKATIAHGLRSLREAPLITLDDSSTLVVELGGVTVDVEAVRQTLLQDDELRVELQEQDVPIAWLLDPDKQNERLDIPDDAPFRNDLLDRVNLRRWVIAEVLYHE